MTTVALIVLGVYQISEGNLTMGGMIAAVMLAGRAIGPLIQLSVLSTRYNQAKSALLLLENIMQSPSETEEDKHYLDYDHLTGRIDLEDVSFSYPGADQSVLKHLTVRIRAGEKIAIIGRIGAGKTTLEKLILGLYKPLSGSVRLDGFELSQLHPSTIRDNIGCVPQDFTLFYGSIRQNIQLGHPHSTDAQILRAAQRAEFEAVKESDLSVLIAPYLAIGIVIFAMFMLILIKKMPHNGDKNHDINFVPTLRRIFSLPHYREGVIAQFFYVGVQIMCWTFIIQYGTPILMAEGMTEQAAEVMSQQYNIIAMVIFCCSRFICTFLLRYINTGQLLMILAIAGGALVCGVIFMHNIYGLYCLVGVSACMSLMFPTIYGIALTGLGDDAKFGAAGLIMSILGGSVLPPLQASIIDRGELFGMPAVNVSFVLPFICFVVIAIYGQRTYMRSKNKLKG
jgi:hypothetical protein